MKEKTFLFFVFLTVFSTNVFADSFTNNIVNEIRFQIFLQAPLVYERAIYGRLDLDVTPEDAAVYINGKYIGICDQFDGFPKFLYLKSGTYDIKFSKKGYLDYQRQIRVQAGKELEFNTHLKKKPAENKTTVQSKQEIFIFPNKTKSTKKIETEKSTKYSVTPHKSDKGKTSDEKAKQLFTSKENLSSLNSVEADADTTDKSSKNHKNGVILFRIFPKDASIYLNNKFIGIAKELNSLQSGFKIKSGIYEIQIFMPGYRLLQQKISLADGEKKPFRAILLKINNEE